MNKTKKLTTGAMLLAIVMALLELDKRLAMFIFSPTISLLFSVVIVIYSTMYTLKDGALLGFCLLVMSFVIGDPQIILYYPIVVLVGIGYSFGVKKEFSKRRLMLTSIVLFIAGEVLITYLLSPLILNISINDQLMVLQESLSEMANNIQTSLEASGTALPSATSSILDSYRSTSVGVLALIYAASVVLMGVMEGLIIHLFSLFLLKRFKIKVFEGGNGLEIKPNKPIAYLSIIALMANIFTIGKEINANIASVITVCSLVGVLILVFYGYIAILLYGRLVLGKNLTLLAIIFVFIPTFWLLLIIVGFLFASGPLYNKIMGNRRNVKS